ncbi:hypothetical protein ACIBH1_14765 [Nonomuraea sp. NPDC050663]|uniref:hypothetical protein n=1 Tax=Nonomuraea sp. NPDC050663 TaxID=3364370 RepID=UPI00378A83AA
MPALDSLLTGLAMEGASGVLRVGRQGAVYLAGGRVTFMECASAIRFEEILTAGGRVSEVELRSAQKDGGQRLVDDGVLSKAELQYCALTATLDAAFFLLPVKSPRPKFVPDAEHWLGPQWFFEVSTLIRESGRRRAELERAWSSAELDAAPVVPVRRLPGDRVMITSLQWEVLLNADGEATPLTLARQLGRPAAKVLLAVRQLAAAGLLVHEVQRAASLPRRVRTDLPAEPHVPTDLDVLLRLRKALEELA